MSFDGLVYVDLDTPVSQIWIRHSWRRQMREPQIFIGGNPETYGTVVRPDEIPFGSLVSSGFPTSLSPHLCTHDTTQDDGGQIDE
jgi:cellulose synthase/poly-beta-1,6-N-acetylglucosamine synthase-like glycosyltransferase